MSIGDTEEQMADELKRKPAEEREEIMKTANFTITVPTEQGLALKSDLCLPWRKLRMMRRYNANTLLKFTLLYLIRWMKSWGVSIASEQKQHCVLQAQLSEMAILGESVPFSFKMQWRI